MAAVRVMLGKLAVHFDGHYWMGVACGIWSIRSWPVSSRDTRRDFSRLGCETTPEGLPYSVISSQLHLQHHVTRDIAIDGVETLEVNLLLVLQTYCVFIDPKKCTDMDAECILARNVRNRVILITAYVHFCFVWRPNLSSRKAQRQRLKAFGSRFHFPSHSYITAQANHRPPEQAPSTEGWTRNPSWMRNGHDSQVEYGLLSCRRSTLLGETSI